MIKVNGKLNKVEFYGEPEQIAYELSLAMHLFMNSIGTLEEGVTKEDLKKKNFKLIKKAAQAFDKETEENPESFDFSITPDDSVLFDSTEAVAKELGIEMPDYLSKIRESKVEFVKPKKK